MVKNNWPLDTRPLVKRMRVNNITFPVYWFVWSEPLDQRRLPSADCHSLIVGLQMSLRVTSRIGWKIAQQVSCSHYSKPSHQESYVEPSADSKLNDWYSHHTFGKDWYIKHAFYFTFYLALLIFITLASWLFIRKYYNSQPIMIFCRRGGMLLSQALFQHLFVVSHY